MKQEQLKILAKNIATDILTVQSYEGKYLECTRIQLMLTNKDGSEQNMGGPNKASLTKIIFDCLTQIPTDMDTCQCCDSLVKRIREGSDVMNKKFVEWVVKNGVSLDHEDVYGIWLDCWNNGYSACDSDTQEKILKEAFEYRERFLRRIR